MSVGEVGDVVRGVVQDVGRAPADYAQRRIHDCGLVRAERAEDDVFITMYQQLLAINNTIVDRISPAMRETGNTAVAARSGLERLQTDNQHVLGAIGAATNMIDAAKDGVGHVGSMNQKVVEMSQTLLTMSRQLGEYQEARAAALKAAEETARYQGAVIMHAETYLGEVGF